MTIDLDPETLADLEAVPIRTGVPLIAVDVDEVLAIFVAHLSDWMTTIGYEMRLTRYELEGSMFRAGTDDALSFAECIGLINRFFYEAAEHQKPIPGGAAVLSALAQDAQVVILTNVPRHARDARRANLDGMGIPYPLVVNSGGKGKAMRWLHERAGAKAVFIDDSVSQIESVAKHAPTVACIHFAWAEHIQRLHPSCPAARARVHDWPSAEAAIRYALKIPALPG